MDFLKQYIIVGFFYNLAVLWIKANNRQSIEYHWANQATSLCGLLYKLFSPLYAWKNRHQETVYWQHETFTKTNPW